MSSETFTYKGISAGKYIEGDIEALSQEEASFKLKEQRIIITNLTIISALKNKLSNEKSVLVPNSKDFVAISASIITIHT